MRHRSRARAAIAVVVLAVVLAGCQWSMYGFGPGRTGWNNAESSIGVGNVGQLQQRWSAPFTGPFAVANDLVYALGSTVGPNPTVTGLRVFDARGHQGCAGSPVVCSPLWTASAPGVNWSGTPAVVNGVLYLTGDGRIYAFDAAGIDGCSGTPKVCQPRWSAPGTWIDPLVDHGTVFAFDDETRDVLAYHAAGSTGCSGSPKVCEPLWRGTAGSFCTFENQCNPELAMISANGRVYHELSYSDGFGRTSYAHVSFDVTGATGCSGVPKVCDGTFGTARSDAGGGGRVVGTYTDFGSDPGFTGAAAIVTVLDAGDHVLWTTGVESVPPGGNDLLARIGKPTMAGSVVYLPVASGIRAYALGQDPMCRPTACVPLWRTTPGATLLTVANGVLYDDRGRAYDAAGSIGCSGSPRVCSPIATIGPTQSNGFGKETETEVVNGWVYRNLTTGLFAFHLPG